ncbi:cupin domain-containing protein [Jiella sp. M17.18]|uniref:cupin domain-containing protein n=1 Tax=Jiella sp. M17.18 TaxID=3234247 RepID=UPI0034DF0483
MNVETHRFEPDSTMPNSQFPLIVMPGAIAGGDASPEAMAARFQGNGWQGTWTYTVFDYWHYHIEGHEVLGCVRGEATVGFGGEDGARIEMRQGDVVIVPAGVGHKRLSATPDFAVVGAYPPGQNGAITRAGELDLDSARAAIGRLARPETDPVTGASPGAISAWMQ